MEDESEILDARSRKRTAFFPPIATIVGALGGLETVKNEEGEIVSEYRLGDECLGCLRDLRRFWKMDESDDDRTVARIFSETQVLQKDIIPILHLTAGQGSESKDRIAVVCAELISAMIWPIDVIEELREAAESKAKGPSKVDYFGLATIHIAYKAAILQAGAMQPLVSILIPYLQKSRRERTPRDENIISLILHILRNLAAIKDRPATSLSSAQAIFESNLQSLLIEQMHDNQVFELLTTIASLAESADLAPWNMITMEIFYLIYRCAEPPELKDKSQKTSERNQTALSSLLDQEKISRRQNGKSSSRHGRFGTTVSVHARDRKYVLHTQQAIAGSMEDVMDRSKRNTAKRARLDSELAPSARLRPKALDILRQTAFSFLETSFNPFFASILKDIRMERAKVTESDNIRFLHLSRFFLEFFAIQQPRSASERGSETELNFGHIAEITTTTAIAYVTSRIKLALDDKPPSWGELHAGVLCFTQFLLTMEQLAKSAEEEDREVSNVLQNKIYYEGETLDTVIKVLTKYTDQSVKYLDAIVEHAYVLLRMLEGYSKNRDYMYIRQKRKARKQKKQQDGVHAGSDDEGEDGDAAAHGSSYAEHAFQFEKFEARFACEAVLRTYIIYLRNHRNSSDQEQVKRVVNLMHRQAVKAKGENLFFKVSILDLFRKIQSERASLPRSQQSGELYRFVDFIIKKFLRAAAERPLTLIEAFYPRRRKGTVYYGGASDSEDEEGLPRRTKAPAELEVKPGIPWSKQLSIAVILLLDGYKQDLLDWVQQALRAAAAERRAIVLEIDGEQPEEIDDDDDDDEDMVKPVQKGPSVEAQAVFKDYVVPYNNEEEKLAGTKDAHLILLLRVLSWADKTDLDSRDRGKNWSIPAKRLPSELETDLKLIADVIRNPSADEELGRAEDLVRKRRKKRVRKSKKTVDGDDEEGEEGVKKRKRKRKEEAKEYKSAQFVEDSDDEPDEEATKAFFEREKRMREEAAAKHGNGDAETVGPVAEKPRPGRQEAADKDGEEEEVSGESSTGGGSELSDEEIDELDSDSD